MDIIAIYRKLFKRISRVLPFHRDVATLDQVPITALHDAILLKIFQYLPVTDLIRASEVCRKWYQLSFDRFLWKSVDLSEFSKTLHTREKLADVTQSYLANKVIALNISGFTLPQEVVATLALHCRGLKRLVVKSVTFTLEKKEIYQDVIFPDGLEHLDLRYSDGPAVVYEAIAKRLENIKWLGLCDALVLAMSSQPTPLLPNLVKIDLSHCKLVKDSFIMKLGVCPKLRLLNLRKCFNISGEFLPVLLESSSCLETLILDGTSVQEEYLQQVYWRNTKIKYLEMGWCPLLTKEGLQIILPEIGRIKTLEYLGLCNVGQGQAVTDYNLEQLGLRLQQGTCPKLHSINLSFSHKITNNGVTRFQSMRRIETLDVTNCSRVTLDVDGVPFETQIDSNVEMYDDECAVVDLPRTRTSRGSFSTLQFALSEYKLETPL